MTMNRYSEIVKPVQMLSVANRDQIVQWLVQGQDSEKQNQTESNTRKLPLNGLDHSKECELDPNKSLNSFTQPTYCMEMEPYTCAECGKGFVNVAALIHHHFIHKGERPCEEMEYEARITADFLLKLQPRTDSGGSHQEIHTQEVLPKFTEDLRDVANISYCVMQKSVFGKPDRFNKLCATVSENQMFYIKEDMYTSSNGQNCTSSPAAIAQQQSFAEEKPFACEECGKSFTISSTLVRHQKTHTGERPYPCAECGKRFVEKYNLLNHHLTHTGVKPYSCEECYQSFTVRSSLLKHKRIHTGEKPYACSVCVKCFSAKATLLQHERVHTGVKAFSCNECGKRFGRRAELCLHKRLHTGERPYACNECDCRFITSSLLIRHIKKAHNG